MKKGRMNIKRVSSYILTVILFMLAIRFPVYAEQSDNTVKVGYFENEIFQEGAAKDSVKTGYAYEYYQKLSEYTGWK